MKLGGRAGVPGYAAAKIVISAALPLLPGGPQGNPAGG